MQAPRIVLVAATVLAGCAGPSPMSAPVSELRLDGKIETTQAGYRGAVTVTNPTQRDASFGLVEFPCAVRLRLYSSGNLAWDQARDVSAQAGGCKWLPSVVTLHPAQSTAVRSAEVPRDTLLATLQAGPYSVFVDVIFARLVPGEGSAGAQTTRIDSVATVPAGTLTLQ